MGKAVCCRWRQKEVGVLTTDGRILKCRRYGKIIGPWVGLTRDCWGPGCRWTVAGIWSTPGDWHNQGAWRRAPDQIGWSVLRKPKQVYCHFNQRAQLQCDVRSEYQRMDCIVEMGEWSFAHWAGNRVHEYTVPDHTWDAYEEELSMWHHNEWLLPYPEEELDPPKGLIPLMAVLQEHKQKVWPVFDYHELNGFVEAFTANTEVCLQRLKEWWQQEANVSFMGLRKAYLQIHINKGLWPF